MRHCQTSVIEAGTRAAASSLAGAPCRVAPCENHSPELPPSTTDIQRCAGPAAAVQFAVTRHVLRSGEAREAIAASSSVLKPWPPLSKTSARSWSPTATAFSKWASRTGSIGPRNDTGGPARTPSPTAVRNIQASERGAVDASSSRPAESVCPTTAASGRAQICVIAELAAVATIASTCRSGARIIKSGCTTHGASSPSWTTPMASSSATSRLNAELSRAGSRRPASNSTAAPRAAGDSRSGNVFGSSDRPMARS